MQNCKMHPSKKKELQSQTTHTPSFQDGAVWGAQVWWPSFPPHEEEPHRLATLAGCRLSVGEKVEPFTLASVTVGKVCHYGIGGIYWSSNVEKTV